MRASKHIVAFLTFLFIAATFVPAVAKDDVGTVIALRGKTVIQRNNKDLQARIKDGILLTDTVSTLDASRAKMLFIDESVLIMGEKSRVVISEFLYSKDKGGKSVLNLIDGKMKSVVGKAAFEVHTPTAVAAARGTVIFFNVAIVNGITCTTILPSEGTVIAKSSSKKIKGSLTLTKDMMATICLDKPLPKPLKASQADKEMLMSDTDITGYEITMPAPAGGGLGNGAANVGAPPLNQQPITTTPTITLPPSPPTPPPPTPPPPPFQYPPSTPLPPSPLPPSHGKG